ncbi:uncharacterized protein LOC34621287 [Cyclospora cayetanensis]|uniref:Uncharacterized protein LOC34621287 n=1 Tax=Cyclospora cayetanensis TaxID=88456 RepID=A0A6P6S0Z6_9EIME|nr:uncharacterized protein LOC34621287 [Cyclospora cayetanensis]
MACLLIWEQLHPLVYLGASSSSGADAPATAAPAAPSQFQIGNSEGSIANTVSYDSNDSKRNMNSSDSLLNSLSEQLDSVAASLKPNAEPVVFPPLSPREVAHLESRLELVFFCLSMTKRHLIANVALLKQLIAAKAPKLDDLLQAWAQATWAGCYNEALSFPPSISLSDISHDEAKALMTPQKTPMKFSQRTLLDIDQAIAALAVSQDTECMLYGSEFGYRVAPVGWGRRAEGTMPSAWQRTNWRDSWWFSCGCVMLIFCFLLFGGKKVARAYRKRHRGKAAPREQPPLNNPKQL